MTTNNAACVLLMIVLALLAGLARTAWADKTFDGTVVSTKEPVGKGSGELVTTDGKNDRTFVIGESVMITLNKKSARLGDLRKGDAVTVTTDDEQTVKTIAATREK
ncbi:MAG: hypothetical protein ACT4QC_16180 [Planctomycetaceae bacterium]